MCSLTRLLSKMLCQMNSFYTHLTKIKQNFNTFEHLLKPQSLMMFRRVKILPDMCYKDRLFVHHYGTRDHFISILCYLLRTSVISNAHHDVSNHWELECLFNSLFGSKKKRNIKVLHYCEGKPPVTGGSPSQSATNTESVPM